MRHSSADASIRSEISDPDGSDLASYRQTYDELEELIGGVVSRVAGPVR